MRNLTQMKCVGLLRDCEVKFWFNGFWLAAHPEDIKRIENLNPENIHILKKINTKIKHVSMELTKTKPICTELKCGNGVSQETNESFDFLITIRIFGLRIVNWMKNIFLLHQENNHFLFFLPSPLRISVVSCPGFFFFLPLFYGHFVPWKH